ncbi:hypothetical protein P7K49_018235 [Saguinus oedipus]|uniref:Uncharacterized protein n=1 Tax=Saguinus oedipus TaxID=9490 RepID=A0ABQ9V602_SAGOE|nr:hypothetical protein P7K49_018235 [Saguinus oedipus]
MGVRVSLDSELPTFLVKGILCLAWMRPDSMGTGGPGQLQGWTHRGAVGGETRVCRGSLSSPGQPDNSSIEMADWEGEYKLGLGTRQEGGQAGRQVTWWAELEQSTEGSRRSRQLRE